MSKKRNKEFLVGLTGIIALLLLYVMINFFKGIDLFKEGELYYVKFDNIGELVSSSPVYINGYKAGNVREISYDFNNMENVIVTLDLDKRLKIPTGSHAEVNNHMLGGCDICIIITKSKEYLVAGDTILGHLNKGITGDMGDVMPTINNMIPKVDSILTSLNAMLANPALGNSINNVEKITNELTATTAQINKLLGNDVPQITERMVAIEDDVLKMSAQMSEIDYKELFARVNATVTNLEAITCMIKNGEGTAGKLIADDALYQRLDSTCAAANALLTDLKENPKRYVHFSVFGGKEK